MLKKRYEEIKAQLDLADARKLASFRLEIALDIEHRYYGLPSEASRKKLEGVMNDIEEMLRWC